MKVLVVEDEALIAMAVVDMLGDAGHQVVGPVGTIAAALALIGERTDLDRALLDVNLRGETSYPIAEALTQQGVPFAFTSGYGHAGIDQRFADRPVLSKPIDEAKLLRFVDD